MIYISIDIYWKCITPLYIIEYKYNTNAIPWHTLYGKWKTQQTHIWVYSEFFVDINIFFVLNVFLVFCFFSFIFIWFCSCSAFGASSSSRSTVSKTRKIRLVLCLHDLDLMKNMRMINNSINGKRNLMKVLNPSMESIASDSTAGLDADHLQ